MREAGQLMAVAAGLVQQSNDSSDSEDILSGVGNEIKVGLDRWSLGQLGVTDLLIAAAVVAAGAVLAWLARLIARRMGRRTSGAAHAAAAVGGIIAGSMILLLSISIAMEVLGFGLGPILVLILMLVLGLLLLRPMITNLSSGLLLQVRGALGAGDLVGTNGVFGTVEEINARSVVIDTSDGRRVHLPNTEVLDGTIENYSSLGRRRSTVEFMVDRSVPLDSLISAASTSLARAQHTLDEPARRILIDRVVGSAIVVRCDVWHDPSMEASKLAKDETVRLIVAALDDLGVALGGSALVALRDDGADAAAGGTQR